MKKFIFCTSQELSQEVEKMYMVKGEEVTATPSFCEETDQDIVVIEKIGVVEEIPFESLLNGLSEHFGHTINHYDEMEVGDFGIGFLFFY